MLSACATPIVRTAVPLELADEVDVLGVENVRAWGDAPIPNIDKIAGEYHRQVLARYKSTGGPPRSTTKYLALSGGGADGAFGSGILNGWTASGTRPEFEIVSGVSAGALIAPFAFLGPKYDYRAREIFTHYDTNDLVREQVLSGLFGGSAVTRSQPLADLIAHYVDRPFLAAIAREHRKGRRLLVGTTNLDAERPVVWDMGRIAVQNSDRALKLFRQVLLASAAIPGVFPPVLIDVSSNNTVYQELHVDGGTTDNAFLLPAHLNLRELDRRHGVKRRHELYVIVNSKTAPDPKIVEATTIGIAGRSISTLIKQQTEGDLLRLYLRARESGIPFKLASVPASFNVESKEPFDKAYMGALYDLGYKLALNGYDWQTVPPGL